MGAGVDEFVAVALTMADITGYAEDVLMSDMLSMVLSLCAAARPSAVEANVSTLSMVLNWQ